MPRHPDGQVAQRYAQQLLASLGVDARFVEWTDTTHPALSWYQSGLMSLTGTTDGVPVMCPAPVATCANAVMDALRHVCRNHALNGLNDLNGADLLSERARLMGLKRNGYVAAGGACRLLSCSDAILAINLPRDDDWAMLPAWLEDESVSDWNRLQSTLTQRSAEGLITRAAVMGLAVGLEVDPRTIDSAAWYQVKCQGPRSDQTLKSPLVLDLSALWAGPLCSHLLQACGARVIKIESPQRPDGAREGHRAFYDVLNAGKDSVALDLKTSEGIEVLEGLLQLADIVIESSRPRALQQLGIDAEGWVQRRPGLTWVSITAYGRDGEQADRCGFGDDVAVSAGLSHLLRQVTEQSMFCGDAIADPLTGMHAALAALVTHQQGGGKLLSVSMREVTAHCANFDLPANRADLMQRHEDWTSRVRDIIGHIDHKISEPRRAGQQAAPIGAHTQNVIAEFGL